MLSRRFAICVAMLLALSETAWAEPPPPAAAPPADAPPPAAPPPATLPAVATPPSGTPQAVTPPDATPPAATPPAVTPAKPTPAPNPAVKPSVEPVDRDQVLAILGRSVAGPEGQEIGRLTDVLVDGTGQPQAAVLDIGGFMGLGSRSIAVHWNLLHFTPTDPKAPIKLALTLDQIKAMPEYKGMDNKPAPVVVRSDVKPAPAH